MNMTTVASRVLAQKLQRCERVRLTADKEAGNRLSLRVELLMKCKVNVLRDVSKEVEINASGKELRWLFRPGSWLYAWIFVNESSFGRCRESVW